MSHTEVLKDVPNGKIGEVTIVAQAGGGKVIVIDQGDGRSTIVATFPDPPPSDAAQAAMAHGATKV